MQDEWAKSEFLNLYYGNSLEQREFFTDEVLDQLRQRFDIPPDRLQDTGLLLEVGAAQWQRETERAKLDLREARKELAKVSKSATNLLTTLGDLSDETLEILHETGLSRTLGGVPYPRLISRHNEDCSGAAVVLEFGNKSCGPGKEIELKELLQMLETLRECVSSAEPVAGAGRVGRPNDNAMFDLLHFAFHVWASILNRPFTLDWSDDTEPVTAAGDFCVHVARIVDASANLQSIATAARKVREEAKPISNLEEVQQVLEHYLKRFS